MRQRNLARLSQMVSIIQEKSLISESLISEFVKGRRGGLWVKAEITLENIRHGSPGLYTNLIHFPLWQSVPSGMNIKNSLVLQGLLLVLLFLALCPLVTRLGETHPANIRINKTLHLKCKLTWVYPFQTHSKSVANSL